MKVLKAQGTTAEELSCLILLGINRSHMHAAQSQFFLLFLLKASLMAPCISGCDELQLPQTQQRLREGHPGIQKNTYIFFKKKKKQCNKEKLSHCPPRGFELLRVVTIEGNRREINGEIGLIKQF